MDERATGESFASLWQDLDGERQARGWTRDRLARRTSQLSQQPCAEKTLHDRMTHGRRVSWEQIMWVVRALELDEQLWKQRWEQANNVRRRSSPPTMTESGTTPNHRGPTADTGLTSTETSSAKLMPASPQFWRSRFASAVPGFLAGVAVTLLTLWGMNRFTNDRPQAAICAVVNPLIADVFITPGDPKPVFTKKRGDQIRLTDTPPTATRNGDRYRMVYTNRTPSGYAYMREDTLSSVVTCN